MPFQSPPPQYQPPPGMPLGPPGPPHGPPPHGPAGPQGPPPGPPHGPQGPQGPPPEFSPYNMQGSVIRSCYSIKNLQNVPLFNLFGSVLHIVLCILDCNIRSNFS